MQYGHNNSLSPVKISTKYDFRKNGSNSPSKWINSTTDVDISQSFNYNKITSNTVNKDMKYSNRFIPPISLSSSKLAFSPTITSNTAHKKFNSTLFSSINSPSKV